MGPSSRRLRDQRRSSSTVHRVLRLTLITRIAPDLSPRSPRSTTAWSAATERHTSSTRLRPNARGRDRSRVLCKISSAVGPGFSPTITFPRYRSSGMTRARLTGVPECRAVSAKSCHKATDRASLSFDRRSVSGRAKTSNASKRDSFVLAFLAAASACAPKSQVSPCLYRHDRKPSVRVLPCSSTR